MCDLIGLRRDLLYVITGLEESHGLAIKRELEAYCEKGIHHGRLYPNLGTFVEKGPVGKDQRNHRTNYYMLTRCGYRETKTRDEWGAEYVPEDFEA